MKFYETIREILKIHLLLRLLIILFYVFDQLVTSPLAQCYIFKRLKIKQNRPQIRSAVLARLCRLNRQNIQLSLRDEIFMR